MNESSLIQIGSDEDTEMGEVYRTQSRCETANRLNALLHEIEERNREDLMHCMFSLLMRSNHEQGKTSRVLEQLADDFFSLSENLFHLADFISSRWPNEKRDLELKSFIKPPSSKKRSTIKTIQREHQQWVI